MLLKLSFRCLHSLALLGLFITLSTAQRGWGNNPGSGSGNPWGDWNPYDGDDNDNTSGGDGGSDGSGSFGGGAGNGVGFVGFDVDQANRYRTVHGIMASVVFLAAFPLGAVFVRTLPGRWALIMHAAAQVVALLLFIAAAGLGIWVLVNVQPFDTSLLDFSARRAHPIVGIFIFALIFAMPVLGFIHHAKFKKYRRRTAVSHVHIWLGRFLVMLGIVNGGLGLHQSGASHDIKVGYAIVAAVSGSLWVFFAVLGEIKKSRERRRMDQDEAARRHHHHQQQQQQVADQSGVVRGVVLDRSVSVTSGPPGSASGRRASSRLDNLTDAGDAGRESSDSDTRPPRKE